VEEAVAGLNRLAGVEIREFLVGPDISERRHVWVLAMGEGSPLGSDRLAGNLDRRLQAANADYATFRGQGRIREPLVVTADEELIYRWSKEERGKLGGQSKIPHIDPTVDGEMVRSLLRFTARQEGSPSASSSTVISNAAGRRPCAHETLRQRHRQGKETPVNMNDIKALGKERGIKTGSLKKGELIRKIQSEEGNNPCFGAEGHACGQGGCLWFEDCQPQ